MKDHRKRIVANGYDAIADPYLEWAAQIEADPRDRMLVEFSARLKPGARVLDIGCGAGVPATKSLAARFVVTGLDISGEQIARARRNVPGATFVVGDVGAVDFPDRSFDGVVAPRVARHGRVRDRDRRGPRHERTGRPGAVSVGARPQGQISPLNAVARSVRPRRCRARRNGGYSGSERSSISQA